MDVQRIKAPDGSEMVVLSAADFDRLVEMREDAIDLHEGEAAREEGERDGVMPAAVLKAILAGKSPVAAWRSYRGLSQAAVADAAGLTQAAVARIEKAAAGAGRPDTRRALAAALNAPPWTLEQQ